MAQEARTDEADLLEGLQDCQQLVWLSDVEASDEAAATEKAAAEYKVPAKRLMALRRS